MYSLYLSFFVKYTMWGSTKLVHVNDSLQINIKSMFGQKNLNQTLTATVGLGWSPLYTSTSILLLLLMTNVSKKGYRSAGSTYRYNPYSREFFGIFFHCNFKIVHELFIKLALNLKTCRIRLALCTQRICHNQYYWLLTNFPSTFGMLIDFPF